MKKIELVKRSDGSFIPGHNSDHEACKRVAPGDSIEGRIGSVRNLRFHKKFFALIKYVFHHMNEQSQLMIPSEEALRYELLRLAGYWDSHVTLYGATVLRPKSIAFDSMDQFEFEKVYSDILDVALKYFVSEVDERELLEFM